jgi:septation ring formation regulator EzrA
LDHVEQQGEMMEESLEQVVGDLDWLVEKQEKRNQISSQGSGPLQ